MANILALKKRIQIAQNVAKTTRAMQMIAASKLRKAQEGATAGRPYVEKLTDLSNNLAGSVDKNSLHNYMRRNDSQNSLFIVISPDKGLCGSLITNIIKEILNSDSKNVFYLAIGKKAEAALLKLTREIVATFPFGNSLPSFDMVFPILNIIDEYFLTKKVSNVSVLYAKFENIFSQKALTENLLPLVFEEKGEKKELVFEPSVNELLTPMLSHFLEMKIYQAILETYASEQAAKMIAMKNATDNAKELIEKFRLEYNKGRQEKITNEILDAQGATFALSNE